MADNLGDFAPALANQSQQQTVSVSSTVSAAAIKHIDNAGVQVDAGLRSTLNFITGPGVTLAFADDPGGDKVNVTVSNTPDVAYSEVTSPVATTATTEAGATAVVGPTSSVTFDGATTVLVQFWAPSFSTNQTAADGFVVLLEDTTVLGRVEIQEINTTGGYPLSVLRRRKPASGSHTYTAKAYTSNGTFTIAAGAGGATTLLPAFLRVTQAGGV